MFIFQKNLFPVTLEDKLKLSLRGSFCIGEEVQSAVFGSLRVMQGVNLENSESDEKGGISSKVKQKKRTYLGTKSVKQNEKMEDEGFEESKGQSQDEKQIVTRGSVIKEKQIEQINALEIDNPSQHGEIKTSLEYARKFVAVTLDEMIAFQNLQCSVVYGTSEGSIGSLFKIPPKVYVLLQLLQFEMDQTLNVDLVQEKRSEYRRVKPSNSTSAEFRDQQSFVNGIIDGDFVETFLELPRSKQQEITAKFSAANGPRGDEMFTELLCQILILLKKTH